MCWQCFLTLESCSSGNYWLIYSISKYRCCMSVFVVFPKYLTMHVYHTLFPSILCKLVPYRWDIPFLMFCTFFSLLLLFALMPLYQPVCGNTYDNNVHQFQDPLARRYIGSSSPVLRTYIAPLLLPFSMGDFVTHL